ncbi:6069_t:CDS:2, partial [Funneliformis caledonium]
HLEIVGFLHSAQSLQQVIMDLPAGYICRLRKNNSYRVPSSLLEVEDLIFLIHEILIAK